jgi:hypothetical protein
MYTSVLFVLYANVRIKGNKYVCLHNCICMIVDATLHNL